MAGCGGRWCRLSEFFVDTAKNNRNTASRLPNRTDSTERDLMPIVEVIEGPCILGRHELLDVRVSVQPDNRRVSSKWTTPGGTLDPEHASPWQPAAQVGLSTSCAGRNGREQDDAALEGVP